MCQIFLVPAVPWTDSLLTKLDQGSSKSKDWQEPEKFDIFRQNLRFQASKVSIFAILQGLPGGVLDFGQKLLKISPKPVIFRLEIENQMNLCF